MTRSTLAVTALFAMMLSYAAVAEQHENHATMQPEGEMHIKMMDAITHAVAVMVPTEGNSTHGTVRFEQHDGSVTVTADISGLTPNSTHAFHVHEFGDITAPDGTSAGGHYNPEGHDHGLPEQSARHAGDLGNLTADENGNAHYEITVDNITVAGMHNPVIGRGVIIHAKTDDGGQPTGNAGARIAMGVIGVAK
ncbi:MAG: superoxide dismutase family protein [Phycisphaerales bacterium]